MKLFLSLTTPYLIYFTIQVITCMLSHESWLKQCTIITDGSDTVDQLIATNCRPWMYSQDAYSSDLKNMLNSYVCNDNSWKFNDLNNCEILNYRIYRCRSICKLIHELFLLRWKSDHKQYLKFEIEFTKWISLMLIIFKSM